MFPFAALAYYGVVLASKVVLSSWLGLGEQISLLHWLGVAAIIGGIALLAEGKET